MKKRIVHPFHVFCILGLALMSFAFSATYASAEFYVIAGSRGVGTEIKSLPYTISSPGFYYITKDLSCAAGTHGITITADNVTLDLMGFSLVGPGGTGEFDGIDMMFRTNVEIRNGTIRDFPRCGIYDFSGTGHRIVSIRAKDNVSSGISLGGKSHIVERCTVVENGLYGIYAGAGSTVTDNTCYNNGNDGIDVESGSTIRGNTCFSNNDDGIEAGAGSTVVGNTCYSNTNYGIELGGYSIVDQNTATANGVNMNHCSTCVLGTNVDTSPVP